MADAAENPQVTKDANIIGLNSRDELINQLEFDHDDSEDDEGGILENIEMDDEGLVVPIPANSVDTSPPPTTIDHGSESFDAQADGSESSSSATSIATSTTGPHITTPSGNQNVYIEQFPSSAAGMPIITAGLEPVYDRYASHLGTSNNPWSPFNSKLDWEIARWAKLRGPGSTAVTDLLKIDGVRFSIVYLSHSLKNKLQLREALGLSYKTSQDLNTIIDDNLPGRPSFMRKEVKIANETYEIYYRDPIKCIEALFSDPEFADALLLKPEKHFADWTKKNCYYHEMNTGIWWWKTQVSYYHAVHGLVALLNTTIQGRT